MFGLMFFPDRGAGFRELLRVLRPGRRAVVSSWAPFEGVFAQVFESVGAVLPDLPFGKGKPPLGDASEFAQEMQVAGFKDVVVHSQTHVMKSPSLAVFWAGMQRTTAPFVLLRRKMGDEKWGEVADGVFERLRTQLGDGPVAAAFRAHLGVGVK